MNFAELKTLYKLTLAPIRGNNQEERLESFYKGQANHYDDFRKKLLPGRKEFFQKIDWDKVNHWIDLGCGTGQNLDFVPPDRLAKIKRIDLVDLSSSLLEVCQERIKKSKLRNARILKADVTEKLPLDDKADLITFSYSLSMISDWILAIENAQKHLRPNGQFAVVDFYVAKKYPPYGAAQHGWFTRNFWPNWFANDNVFLSPDLLPYLKTHFSEVALSESFAELPYLPGLKVPYFYFIGTKMETTHKGQGRNDEFKSARTLGGKKSRIKTHFENFSSNVFNWSDSIYWPFHVQGLSS